MIDGAVTILSHILEIYTILVKGFGKEKVKLAGGNKLRYRQIEIL